MGPGVFNNTNANGATPVVVCGWQLYAYFNAFVWNYRSRKWSAAYVGNDQTVVQLGRSTGPLLGWWYIFINVFFIDIGLHTSMNNLDLKQQALKDMSSSKGS